MELYGQKSKNITQKILINLIEIFLLWISYWILFQSGGEWLEDNLNIQNAAGLYDRRMLIFLFNIITFLRIAYSMVFLINRKITWEESAGIIFAFGLYFVGFPILTLHSSEPINGLDYFALFLFAAGSILNSGGEILRDRWKKKPENQEKIYVGGFFKYSRHINFFGDTLWVAAYSIVTRNLYAAAIPVFLFCFFAFFNAPKLDEYLKKKYGKDYDEYAKRTKKLIPFIY